MRPYTAPSTAYNAWSTTWPVLAITGPAVAVTSLLAIPFVAVAAGGTALASLTSIGSSIASGAAGAAESAAATAAAAAGFAAKASRVPGAGKVKGKLADAAKDLVGERITPDKVQQHVVRYLARAGGAGAAGAGAGAAEGPQLIEGESEEAKVRRVKKEKKLEEVDVTGHDLEKVLKCDTGHSATDKVRTRSLPLLLKPGLSSAPPDVQLSLDRARSRSPRPSSACRSRPSSPSTAPTTTRSCASPAACVPSPHAPRLLHVLELRADLLDLARSPNSRRAPPPRPSSTPTRFLAKSSSSTRLSSSTRPRSALSRSAPTRRPSPRTSAAS